MTEASPGRARLPDRAQDLRPLGSRPRYRPDIDGLRALAIIPVVGFHAFPSWVRGGFVGVDVFFVISGYLISLLIWEQLDRGAFTFTNFYARRIRRIFPALLLILAACLAFGWFGLFAEEYAALGKHVAGGAGFAANLLLWSEAGYFDTVSEAKPLLHLWSLGIEEQFYLLWPALLYGLWRTRSATVRVCAVVAALTASFLVNAVQVRSDEVAAFYSPVTRLWELLLGAAFAALTLARTHASFRTRLSEMFWARDDERLRNAAAWMGLAAVIAAALLFDRDTSFPGWRAALPAGGALLLIAAGPDAWLNRRVLAMPALVWVGLISYPLYLWHWPLLSLATVTAGSTSTALRAGLIVLSVVLAWLTYVVVERPIRFGWRGRAPVAALAVLMVAAGTAGYVAYATEGFVERPINRSDQAHFLRYYERLRQRGLRDAYRAGCDFMDWDTEATRAAIDPECTLPGERGTVFLWGDSHAQALSPGLRAILPAGVRLAQVTTSGCAPRLKEADPQAAGGRCTVANRYARERIAALRPEVVVLAQIMAHEATDWTEIARAVRGLGARHVILAGPMPQWLPTLPAVVTRHHWQQDIAHVATGLHPEPFTTDRLLRERYADHPDLEYVSLIDALCPDVQSPDAEADAGCLAFVPDTDRQLIVVDNSHLSPAGSTYVARTIFSARLEALPEWRPAS